MSISFIEHNLLIDGMGKSNNNDQRPPKTYGFTRVNLWILMVSIAIIVIGYVLLAGGKSTDGISFNPEVFNTRRIGIAPVILTIGYLGILVAIIWRGKVTHHDNKIDTE